MMEFDRRFSTERIPPLWRPEVEAWVRRMRYLDRSTATVTTWGSKGIQHFAIWLDGQGRLAGVEAVRGSDIEEWMIAFRESNSSTTQMIRYSGVKSFFTYLTEEGIISANPMARLKPPSVKDSKEPAVLEPDYIKALLKAAEGNDFSATRNKALIRFFLESGGRNSEVLSMRIDRINQNDRSAVVRRKGGGERTLRYGEDAAYLLDRYLLRRRRHPKAGLPNLWIGRQGPLQRDSVNRLLKRLAMAANLPPAIHAHLFRHTWADGMKRADVSDESLRELGGWSPTSTIPLRYGRSKRAERAKAELENKRPFDRFG